MGTGGASSRSADWRVVSEADVAFVVTRKLETGSGGKLLDTALACLGAGRTPCRDFCDEIVASSRPRPAPGPEVLRRPGFSLPDSGGGDGRAGVDPFRDASIKIGLAGPELSSDRGGLGYPDASWPAAVEIGLGTFCDCLCEGLILRTMPEPNLLPPPPPPPPLCKPRSQVGVSCGERGVVVSDSRELTGDTISGA